MHAAAKRAPATNLQSTSKELLKRYRHLNHRIGHYFRRAVTRQLQRALDAGVDCGEGVALGGVTDRR